MLELYIKTKCPYCVKVIEYAAKHSIKMKIRNIHKSNNLANLLTKGGKRQVPFLADRKHGIFMYESDDIIKYLKENYINN